MKIISAVNNVISIIAQAILTFACWYLVPVCFELATGETLVKLFSVFVIIPILLIPVAANVILNLMGLVKSFIPPKWYLIIIQLLFLAVNIFIAISNFNLV